MECKTLIIGSGPAAIGSLLWYVNRKIPVTLIDVGKKLEPGRLQLLDTLSQMDRSSWTDQQLIQLTDNSTLKDQLIPKKEYVGSNFFYENLQSDESFPVAYTHAKGGFTIAWGGAMLPAATVDMVNWPFGRDRLEVAYKELLKSIPVAFKHDSLDEQFPAYKYTNSACNDKTIIELIDSLSFRSNKNNKEDNKIFVGNSRLAVDVNDKSDSRCRLCGFCLSGCAYNSVFNTSNILDKAVREGLVRYINGYTVESINELNGVVEVRAKGIDSNLLIKANKVLIGAGAIPTTNILVNSINLYGKDIKFIDSQKFLLPMLIKNGLKDIWPNSFVFANMFLEQIDKSISPYWQHTQVSPINDLLLRKWNIISQSSLLRSTFKPVLQRLLFGWAGVHSELSHSFTVNFKKNTSLKKSDFKVIFNINTKKIIKKYVLNLSTKTFGSGLFVFPMPIIGTVTGGNHFGGSFPMQGLDNTFRTDILGRPFGWRKVHIVDSSAFPSIPSTTVVLLTMANAYRIADESVDVY